MSSSVDKSSGTQSLLTGQNIVYLGIGWAVVSMLFFLLFSVKPPGEEYPFWYSFSTYLLECLPFLGAALLCYRNWRSPQIASGRNVWLGIGLGMLFYFIANVIFGVWELYFGLDPDVSPADFFYVISYICIGWGMILAVLPRRLNLEWKQWVTVGLIAALGIALAVWVLLAPPVAVESEANNSVLPTTESATARVSPRLVASLSLRVAVSPTEAAATPEAEVPETGKLPGWVISLDQALSPLSKTLNFVYIVFDVFLLIIASTLLLAFWGGRFAQSWRMIAAATFSLYIADMGFKAYGALAKARGQEYESGGLLDVFFIFSALLFAIGAALEYDVSSRSRRGSRRRT
ncbi:hypothetical protein [Coleofasciculus chthonoplastes]|jgi:hypothetical protein|uniref:hypothetical protein n=1 Tax=Coleofasciculus chthonoplastes TaxID=64178 RepID=UPI0032F8D867